MIIDSHQHFWKYDPARLSWIDNTMASIRKDFLPEDLQPILQRYEIDGCISVQVEHSEAETAFLLDCAAKNDFIKGVVGWVDLTAANAEERLQHFSSDPAFKGIRHTVYDQKGEFLLEPSFITGLKNLQNLGLSFDLLVFQYQLSSALVLVKKFPDQKFVLNHLAKPAISEGLSSEWKILMKELGSHKNVFAKLSGLVTETDNFKWEQEDFRPFLDVMIESFGTERLMFGSDWPVSTCAASYGETLGMVKTYFDAFSENEKQAVFGRNVVEFYRL